MGSAPKIRAVLRSLHRDAGYLAVGLTFIYALSGLAMNHVEDWDPNFRNFERETDVPLPLPTGDKEAASAVLRSLGVKDRPRDVYRAENRLDISLDKREVHVDLRTGHVVDQGQKPRFLLRVANWLHYNRGKKAWTYVADGYAAFLLFLAVSGMFMLPGKRGLFGRGAIFVVVGVAAPIAYVVWSGGP